MKSHVKDRVLTVLKKFPETRGDDHLLYFVYLSIYHTDVSFSTAFLKWKELGISPYHSVARARREVQEQNEDLRATKEVQEARLKEEINYYNNYKGN